MTNTPIQDRRFPRAGEFEAYHDCERWLRELGCSIGSMQRGAPINNFAGLRRIAKGVDR